MSEHGLYVSYAPRMIDSIVKGEVAVVLGSRLKGGGSAIAQGMPWCEYMSNRFRTGGEHSCFGLGVSEYHTGSRVFSHEVLKGLNSRMPSDSFVFDQEIISPVVAGGFRLAEFVVPGATSLMRPRRASSPPRATGPRSSGS